MLEKCKNSKIKSIVTDYMWRLFSWINYWSVRQDFWVHFFNNLSLTRDDAKRIKPYTEITQKELMLIWRTLKEPLPVFSYLNLNLKFFFWFFMYGMDLATVPLRPSANYVRERLRFFLQFFIFKLATRLKLCGKRM